MLIGRLSLTVAVLGLGTQAMPVLAQGSLPDQIATCARIGKKDARLECYDSIARAAAQGAYTPSFGASSIRTPQGAPPPLPPGTQPAGSTFGAEQIERPIAGRNEDAGEREISATVASARDNGLQMWQFNLTDGAVWRMTERVSNFRPPAPNEAVTISKGALGSYLMQVGKQAAVRVQRIR